MQKKSSLLAVAVVLSLIFADALHAEVLHRWSFNGNANDSVGGATAVLFDGAVISGNALDFTVNPKDPTARAELPIQSSLQTNISNEITYEFWYQLDSLNANHRLFISGDVFTEAFQFIPIVGTSGVAQYRSDSTHGILSVNSGPATVNTAYHVAMTYKDNDAFSVYINGALLNTTSTVGKASAGLTNFAKNLIGANWTPGLARGASGIVDEFRVYNNALSADQVAQHFANGPDGSIVPEPASLSLLLICAILLGRCSRRR